MAGGFINRIGGFVGKLPGGRKLITRLAIKQITNKAVPRPHPYSLWSPAKVGPADFIEGAKVESSRYTSWPGLVDREYTGRHLPPADKSYTESLPHPDQIKELFVRNKFKPAPTTSALFPFFAQWFTDSFLRTHPIDRRRNTSNHEIDLCQIYGLKESTSDVLRAKDENGKPDGTGKLGFEMIGGDEYGEKIYRQDVEGLEAKKHLKALPYLKVLDKLRERGIFDSGQQKQFYASGLERGNSTIGYSAVSTIFRREHNRLCDEIKKIHPAWKGDRLFQTARNVNIALLLKLILEEYVSHLADSPVNLKLEVGYAEKQRWYRTNRIAIEFDLLYRWHALVPTTFALGGKDYDHKGFRYNNPLLEKHGVEEVIKAASRQPAGDLVLNNTPKFLEEAELGAIKLARQFHVRSYTEYCKAFNERVPRNFRELTGEKELAGKLEGLYTKVKNVEFVIGLLAEKRSKSAVLGDLMRTMVGVDAFSQVLTNPLLSQNVFGADTFSDYGLQTISETRRFADMVRRNCGSYDPDDVVASFDVVS